MKPIPVFTPDQAREALRSCVYNGVAKMTGALSEASAERLLKITADSETAIPADIHLSHLPELQSLRDELFSDGALDPDAIFNFYPGDEPGRDARMSIGAHIDNFSSTIGLSVLYPLTGQSAAFGASSSKFEFHEGLFEESVVPEADVVPDYVAEYGVGDAMFIRQSLAVVDGRKLNLPQVYHCGAGPTDRRLVGFDVVTSSVNLTLPGRLCSLSGVVLAQSL